MSEPVSEKLGKYTLVRHLATGGMAEIWLAEQEGPGGFNKQLVIKRVLPHLARDSQFTQMFLDEARLVAQLTHPNIGQIYELGEIEGSYFIAMEYIEGLDGSDVLEMLTGRGQRMPIGLAVYATIQVLQALDYAHDFIDRDGNFVGLVHRDVTPHNVIISNDGVIKLVDFGVAKAKANHSKTQTGAVKGKLAYMAPEQIASSPDLDRRVDIFAVGVMFYEFLTGSKPFGEDLVAVNAILNTPTPDPRELRPEIPQSLVNIINLALAKKREERYQGAQALMDDLQDFMRASGMRGNQRELAAFVRELQGLEVTHSWQTQSLGGPRARITEREHALTAPGTPSTMGVKTGPQSPALTPSSHAPEIARPQTAPQQPVQQQPHATSSTAPVNTLSHESVSTSGGGSAGLVVAFLVVVVAILGAGAVVFYLFIQPDDSPKKKTPDSKVTKTTKEVTDTKKEPSSKPKAPVNEVDIEKADPSPLTHKDGFLVFVRSDKKAKVYYEGKYLGLTPLKLFPRKGSYALEITDASKKSAKKVKHTIKVKESMGMQSFDLTL